MSHRDNCPSEESARERGRDHVRSGYSMMSAPHFDCHSADEAFADGARYERRRQESRRQARQEEEWAEQEFYAQQDEQRALAEAEQRHHDDMLAAEEAAHYASERRHELVDLPTWADDGGAP